MLSARAHSSEPIADGVYKGHFKISLRQVTQAVSPHGAHLLTVRVPVHRYYLPGITVERPSDIRQQLMQCRACGLHRSEFKRDPEEYEDWTIEDKEQLAREERELWHPSGEHVFDLAPYADHHRQLLRCVGSVKGDPPRLLTADMPDHHESYVVQLPYADAVPLELHDVVLQPGIDRVADGAVGAAVRTCTTVQHTAGSPIAVFRHCSSLLTACLARGDSV